MRRSTLCAVIMQTSLIAGTSVFGGPPAGDERIYKTIEGRQLKLYVTKPDDWKASDNRPAVVFFHGGGWVGGQPGQFTEHCKHLAERGLVCVQVQYRLLDRNSDEPPATCVEDATDAMLWVRSHADELGIDSDRIASAGGSAGGHLAAWLGTVKSAEPEQGAQVSAKPNAMILFNAVYDNGPDGWGQKRVKDRYPEFSPAHNIT